MLCRLNSYFTRSTDRPRWIRSPTCVQVSLMRLLSGTVTRTQLPPPKRQPAHSCPSPVHQSFSGAKWAHCVQGLSARQQHDKVRDDFYPGVDHCGVGGCFTGRYHRGGRSRRGVSLFALLRVCVITHRRLGVRGTCVLCGCIALQHGLVPSIN